MRDITFFTRFVMITACAAPFSFLRAFHFFKFASVWDRSVDASSEACLVNHAWFIEAVADMLRWMA